MKLTAEQKSQIVSAIEWAEESDGACVRIEVNNWIDADFLILILRLESAGAGSLRLNGSEGIEFDALLDAAVVKKEKEEYLRLKSKLEGGEDGS